MATIPSGIYVITNTTNNKQYVGQAVDLLRRQRKHWNALRGQYHRNQHLQNAWNKYGEDSFVFEVLEYIAMPEGELTPAQMRDFLKPYEQRWMDKLEPAYNQAPAAGSQLGYKFSQEAKAKVSEAGRGRVQSEETKRKRAAHRIGTHLSDETKAKIGAAQREYQRRVREGEITPPPRKPPPPISDATRAKLSAIRKGKPRPPHVIKAMREGWRRWNAKRSANANAAEQKDSDSN